MDFEREISEIKQRNERVELDKAWETSFLRRAFVSAITYVVAFTWLVIIGESNVMLKATVPVLGYIISTLALPWLRGIWMALRQ